MQTLKLSKINNFSQTQLNQLLIYLCEHDGSIEDIEFITTDKQLELRADIFYIDSIPLKIAAYYGHLDAIKFFLTSKKLTEHVDVHVDEDYAYHIAAERGYLDIVEYLLTSSELSEHSNPYSHNHAGFKYACSHRHKDVVDFLCSIPEIYKPDFLAGEQQGFHDACEGNHVEFAKYLLSLSQKVSPINVVAHDNKAWKTAVNRNSLDILEFLYTTFPQIKQSLHCFEHSGLNNPPESCDNNYQDKIKTVEFLFNLPEIKSLLKQDEIIESTFLNACNNQNLTRVNYILSELDYTPSENFVKTHKRMISKDVKTLILKKQLYKNLDETVNKTEHKTVHADTNNTKIKTTKKL